MPKPSPRRAIAWPMRPQPTIPSVMPVVSPPTMCVGYHGTHSPSRTWRSPSLMRRAMPSSSANAMSAVASVSTPGVLPTAMPRLAASSRSMLSVPTARLATALTDGAASKSSASTFSVMIVSSASACAACSSRASRGGGALSSQRSTSCSACSRSSAGNGNARVMKTFPTAPSCRLRSPDDLAPFPVCSPGRSSRPPPSSAPAASPSSPPRAAPPSPPASPRRSRCASRARARCGSTSASPREERRRRDLL